MAIPEFPREGMRRNRNEKENEKRRMKKDNGQVMRMTGLPIYERKIDGDWKPSGVWIWSEKPNEENGRVVRYFSENDIKQAIMESCKDRKYEDPMWILVHKMKLKMTTKEIGLDDG